MSCHTTGFEYNSGWKSAELTPLLEGNQCENCHGPSSKHVEQPDNAEFRKAIARTVEGVEKSHFCIGCHDEDNSPKFDFATDYKKIAPGPGQVRQSRSAQAASRQGREVTAPKVAQPVPTGKGRLK